MSSVLMALSAAAVSPLVAVPGSSWEPYALAGAAMLGVAARAYFTNGQRNVSRETIQDVVIGGVLGYLWTVPPITVDLPIIGELGWPPFHFPATWALGYRAVIIGALTWGSIDTIKKIVMRLMPALFERYVGSKLNGASSEAKPTEPPRQP